MVTHINLTCSSCPIYPNSIDATEHLHMDAPLVYLNLTINRCSRTTAPLQGPHVSKGYYH